MPVWKKTTVPMRMATVISALFIGSVIKPYSPVVWYANVLPIVTLFAVLLAIYRYFQFAEQHYAV